MMYCDWEWIKVILYIKQYFKWDKVSLLSHSMGSLAARRYSGLFPDDVDLYIGIDILVYGYLYENLDKVMDMYPTLIQKAAISQTRLKNEPPLYTLNEITKIKYFGSNKSVALKRIPYLLERGIKQSEHNPTKYYFTRDPRTKYILFANERNEFIENLIKRLKCPTLFIKATDSPYENDKSSAELQNKLQKNNEKYESHTVLGTHHVHLNDPEKVAPLILNFLNKYMKR
ncbi:unnamed protein product [Arctia plantaginis]|nr:unnamed protein product [Arctia plantaginis]